MRRLLALFILGAALSFIIYPSSLIHLEDSLPDDNDTRLIAYIISQVQNNLLNHQPLYTGTFFAPYQNTLTYSDLFLTTATITLPFRLLTSSPVAIFNLAYLINSSLTFVTAFYFSHVLTKSNQRALFATSVFFLSGYHLAYLPHLQVYSLWAVFLALFFFQRRSYSLFFLAFSIQMAESLFPLYLILFATTIFYFYQPVSLKSLFFRALPFVPLWLLLLYPYLQLTTTFPEAVRPIRDAAHFSLGIEEIFTKYRSPLLLLLLIISLFFKTSKKLAAHYCLLATGLLLSLGPVLKLQGSSLKVFDLPIPLPYALFYYTLPGFQGLRTPSRFILLALIAACAIIATRLPKLKPVYLLLIITLLLWQADLPRPGYTINLTPPSVYQTVKALPTNAVILELPILLWNQPGHEIESVRSLYSLDHAHRRVGGFSGFAPLAWIDLVEQVNTHGLNQDNVSRLRLLGVTHVIEKNHLQPLQ